MLGASAGFFDSLLIMVRILFYLGLMTVGVVSALVNPLAGAIACLCSYLLNPISLIEIDLRCQLVSTLAFFVGFLMRRPQGLRPVGREGAVLKALWGFVAIGRSVPSGPK